MLINTPVTFNKHTAQNRVVFQPMEGCDATSTGAPGTLAVRRYMQFAQSGAGIIWMGATAAVSEGRAGPRQLFLNENSAADFEKLLTDMRTRAREAFGFAPLIIMQMTHSGRFSNPDGAPRPLVAYRNSLWERGRENQPYTVVTDDYCDDLVAAFGNSARLAAQVGFDGVDVKCCHGYLFNEFLSAHSRTGKYGGNLENRTRLYFSCVDEVKRNISDDMFVTTRLNACDCFPYPFGFGVDEKDEIDLTETKSILTSLSQKGVELVNLTIGNPYLIPHINRPALNCPEKGEDGLNRIKNITKQLQSFAPQLKIVISGLSYPAQNCIEYAESLLSEKVGTLTGFGRMTFAYPDFYADFLKEGTLQKNKCCLKCSKCTELMRHGSVTGCPIRDSEVYMPYYNKFVLNKGD